MKVRLGLKWEEVRAEEEPSESDNIGEVGDQMVLV